MTASCSSAMKRERSNEALVPDRVRRSDHAEEAARALPSAQMYETSYAHRDVVTHVVVTPFTHFIVTASRDGQIKFWKKQQVGIEFVKHYRAHLAPITSMAASPDGVLLATTAADKGIKVFDVLAFDMINWIKLEYTPGACEFISGRGAARALLACASSEDAQVHVFDAVSDGSVALHTLRHHTAPVLHMQLNTAHAAVVSTDTRGVIEYWANDGDFSSAPQPVPCRATLGPSAARPARSMAAAQHQRASRSASRWTPTYTRLPRRRRGRRRCRSRRTARILW